MGGRFLLGFGNSLSQMASPLLLTEICHPQHRGPVTAIYNCLWNAGALLVTCLALGTINIDSDYSWRTITFLQIVPSFIQFCGIWFLPESPRFLINKDRHEEALRTLAEWHAGGDVNNATVQFEFREIKETIRIQKEIDRGTKFIDFFRTRGNRWRLAIIMSLGVISQYSGNAIFSNYMNVIYRGAGIKDEQERQKLAMSAGKITLDLIVTVTAALNVDRFGRRPLFLVSTCGMVISMACWTISGAMFENSDETNMVWGYIQFGFIWLFGIFYDIGFSGLLVAYALEVLPFHLRAKGMMIMNITVQAVLAIGKYAYPSISESMVTDANLVPAKPTRLPGSVCPSIGTLCCFTPSGTRCSSFSSILSTSRQRAPRSRRWPASLTARAPSPRLTCARSKKRFITTRSTRSTSGGGEGRRSR